jgi:electron transfer flavoprotein alpha/beta subunit
MNRRVTVQSGLGKKRDPPISKIIRAKKKDCRYDSSSRMPALQEGSPEFKPQHCQKKKKKKKREQRSVLPKVEGSEWRGHIWEASLLVQSPKTASTI